MPEHDRQGGEAPEGIGKADPLSRTRPGWSFMLLPFAAPA
jgi:hypothetical protein